MQKVEKVKKSARRELEITFLNNIYLKEKSLTIQFWA
jgi:dTDP-glucose pyrophosphorylase